MNNEEMQIKISNLYDNLREDIQISEKLNEEIKEIQKEVLYINSLVKSAEDRKVAIIMIRIDGIDVVLGICKNIISISLTGWIALLALPNLLNIIFVKSLCMELFFISLALIISLIIYRHNLISYILKIRSDDLNSSINDIKKMNGDITHRTQRSIKTREQLEKRNSEYAKKIESLKNITL